MKTVNILMFLLIAYVARGQVAQSDTFLSKVKSAKVNSYDKGLVQASKGAAKYINSLLGDTFYHNHIKINFKQTEVGDFRVCCGKSGDAKVLETHHYYDIHYYVIQKTDTLSYFNLLVDSIGTLTPFDKDYSFSSPTKLFLSYRKLFANRFTVDFKKAVAIVKQHGFHNKPFLDYHIEDNKEGCYWRVSKKQVDGKRRVLNINADTGETKEFYFPAFEE